MIHTLVNDFNFQVYVMQFKIYLTAIPVHVKELPIVWTMTQLNILVTHPNYSVWHSGVWSYFIKFWVNPSFQVCDCRRPEERPSPIVNCWICVHMLAIDVRCTPQSRIRIDAVFEETDSCDRCFVLFAFYFPIFFTRTGIGIVFVLPAFDDWKTSVALAWNEEEDILLD